jgi:hypothetical protein
MVAIRVLPMHGRLRGSCRYTRSGIDRSHAVEVEVLARGEGACELIVAQARLLSVEAPEQRPVSARAEKGSADK